MNSLLVPSNLFRHSRIDNSSALYLGQVELRWRTFYFLEAIAHSTLGRILPRVSQLKQPSLRDVGLFLSLEDEGDARVTLPPTIYPIVEWTYHEIVVFTSKPGSCPTVMAGPTLPDLSPFHTLADVCLRYAPQWQRENYCHELGGLKSDRMALRAFYRNGGTPEPGWSPSRRTVIDDADPRQPRSSPVSELSRSSKRRAPLEGGRFCDMSSPIPWLGVNVGRPTMLLNPLWDYGTVAIVQDAGVLARQRDGHGAALPGRVFIPARWFGSCRFRRIRTLRTRRILFVPSLRNGQAPLNTRRSPSTATASRQSRKPGPFSFAVPRSFHWQGHHHSRARSARSVSRLASTTISRRRSVVSSATKCKNDLPGKYSLLTKIG
jgi:hypothetical protein